MRPKYHFWILVIVWHLLLGWAGYYILQEHYAWFMLVQVLLLLSVYSAYQVYRSFQRPLELVEAGRGALKDRDFSIKYRRAGILEVDALVDVYNDMIDSLREERTNQEAQHYFLQKLIEASPSGVLILDFDGDISQVNPAACALLGFDPLEATTDDQLSHPLLQAIIEIEAGQEQQMNLQGTDHYRIEARSFIDRGFDRKFVQIQRLTEEILAAEKRAYGKVIRMMAHEVNNSIGAVNALLQTLGDPDAPTDDAWVKDVKDGLQIATERNQKLNVFMRNFAEIVRLPSPYKTQVDLGLVLASTARLFQAQAQLQNTEIQLKIPEQSVFFKVDTHQLEQVLVNLIKNALESLQEGGVILLELGDTPLRIIVADNGPGLSEDAAAAIFTPFFTTKATGQGIGLTLVRDILNNHDLHYHLRTDEDGWTRFVIKF
jgi:nitrogen fixation/metabolism regulation signal transduction histidine kinase